MLRTRAVKTDRNPNSLRIVKGLPCSGETRASTCNARDEEDFRNPKDVKGTGRPAHQCHGSLERGQDHEPGPLVT